MPRVLVIAALALGSVAGLSGCGSSPLNVDGGHTGTGGGAAAGAGARAGATSGTAGATTGTAGAATGTAGATTGTAGATTGTAGAAGSAADAAVERVDAAPDADAAVDRADAGPGPGADGAALVDASVMDASDASLVDVQTWETPPSGWLAFDMTATIALSPPSGGQTAEWANFPTTAHFQMAWAPADALLTIMAATSTVTPAGAAFTTDFPTFAQIDFAGSCGGGATLGFDTLRFYIGTDGTLHGDAMGSVTFQQVDVVAEESATYALTGIPDVTPPTMDPVNGTVDPLLAITPAFSEPLAPGGTMTLVGTTSGDRVPLAPSYLGPNDDPTQPILGFNSPDDVLRWGEVYKIETTGLKDLAGNALTFTTPPTATTPAAPPLQAEDGFEAVTGPTFAGAGVLKGGPLAPIAGTTSLVVGNVSATFMSYQIGTSLALRLAVKPGDTVLRFDRRLVAPNNPPDPAWRGAFFVGAVGKPLQSDNDVLDDFSQVALAGGGVVWESAVGTTTLPLPAGASGEISFEIVTEPTDCETPPPLVALILDNLRVE
jgi:hypothetical protein